MPQDPVFTDPAQTTASGSAASTSASTSTSASGSQATQVAGAPAEIDTKIAQAVAPIAASLGNVEKFMRETSEFLQSQQTQRPAATPSDDEWMNGFYASPKGQVASTVQEAAAPLVGAVAESHAALQLDKFHEQIDAKWGTGAWEKVLSEPMGTIVKRAMAQNPASVLNTEAMRSTLNSLVGQHVDALADHRTSVQSSKGEHETKDFDAAMQASLQRQGVDFSTLSGGIRRAPGAVDKLPDEAHEYLAGQLRDSGRVVDEKRLAAMLNVGQNNTMTLSQWEKANAELEGKKS